MHAYALLLGLMLAWLPGTGLAEPDDTRVALVDETAALPAEVSPAKMSWDDLALYALSLNGTAYKFGGRNPESGLDCSGFVGHVFREVAGIELPRDTRGISQVGRKIGVEELKPGDLVFFNTLRRAFSHVGIYLGDNQFIHASSSRTGNVMVSNMSDSYWARRFDGARRLETPAE